MTPLTRERMVEIEALIGQRVHGTCPDGYLLGAVQDLHAEIRRLEEAHRVGLQANADLACERGMLEAEIARLRSRLEQAEKGLSAVLDLMNESRGVAGLHLNGDEAPWDELRTGGRFESWLLDFDAALGPQAQASEEGRDDGTT